MSGVMLSLFGMEVLCSVSFTNYYRPHSCNEFRLESSYGSVWWHIGSATPMVNVCFDIHAQISPECGWEIVYTTWDLTRLTPRTRRSDKHKFDHDFDLIMSFKKIKYSIPAGRSIYKHPRSSSWGYTMIRMRLCDEYADGATRGTWRM
jgi:hypothetical protein